MRPSISDVFEFDDEIHDYYEGLGNKFIPLLRDSDFPQTSRTLVGLMGSVNSIKLAIFDLAEASETHLYEIKILRRTLIEHYLRFYYVLFRCLKENSDEVGEEFRKYSYISETIAFLKASDVSNQISGKATDQQVYEKVKKEHPEFNVSKNQITKITSRWGHRNVIRYLKEQCNLIEDGSPILRMIPEYAQLSSFLHGGTLAQDYYHEVFGSGHLEDIVYREVSQSCFLASIVKLHLLLLVIKIDDQFADGIVHLTKLLYEYGDKFFDYANGNVDD